MKHLLYTILILSTINISAQNYSGGAGTEVDPYCIKNLDNLLYLSTHSSDWDKHFLQISDIDAKKTSIINIGNHDNNLITEDEAMGLSPIGNDGNFAASNYYVGVCFTGSYNGDNYIIYDLYINRPNLSNVGLFGYASFSQISNINLLDCIISGNTNTGALVGTNGRSDITNCSVNGIITGNSYHTGGLVGISTCHSTITNCITTGLVTSNNIRTGGIAGNNHYSALISNCFSTCDVNGLSQTGGISGLNDYDSMIKNSYSSGSITGSTKIGGITGENCSSQVHNSSTSCIIMASYNQCGGLVGYNNYTGYTTKIVNSFATGCVKGNSEIGGLVGKNNKGQIEYSYSTGAVKGNSRLGGLVGYNTGNTASINKSFYDSETSGIENTGIGLDENNQNAYALSTGEFKEHNVFGNAWPIIPAPNDDKPWLLNPDGRPYLYWQEIAISNGVCQENIQGEFLSIGDLLNVSGVNLIEAGYRYKLQSSLNWTYKPIENKDTPLKLYFTNIEINSAHEYYVQAYVKDIDNNFYFGDASVKKNNGSTLPVSLLYFDAEKTANETNLSWATASEINNDFFTIEVSDDAVNWDLLDIVYGQGNSNIQNTYSLKTESENSILYYRLSQTDFDGTTVVLETIIVDASKVNQPEISIYPNPTSDFITINNCPDGMIYLYTIRGEIMIEKHLCSFDNTINLTEFKAGIYIIRFGNYDSMRFTIVK